MHEIIFLIGDFTGLVGDPSGVNETRPVLSEEEIKKKFKNFDYVYIFLLCGIVCIGIAIYLQIIRT